MGLYFINGSVGSSPRVRSGPPVFAATALSTGIISACAERTDDKTAYREWSWDHLRVCGADADIPWL